MPLNIIHLSISPLAGQPYRLVKALQRYTNYDACLIDLNRWNIYPHDIVFNEEPERCIELVQKADIIHFHNYLDLNSTAFAPLDFQKIFETGKAFIRQIHSEPGALSRIMGITEKDVVSCELPTLVIAQYPERFFPNARVVPNNLPIDSPDYSPSSDPASWDLLYSPSRRNSAWDDRWNTKGAPETTSLMGKIAKETGCLTKIITNRSLSEVLYEKRRSYIVLDDMITGSYHVSGLEGLSMAKPTLTYLDERIRNVLIDISGAYSVPFINTQLENADTILKYLLKHKDEGIEIGQAGRQWLEQYWSEESIIQHFKDGYEKLLFDPSLICRQKSLSLNNETKKFFALTLPDLIYKSRKVRYTDFSLIISECIRILGVKISSCFLTFKSKIVNTKIGRFLLSPWHRIKTHHGK